LPQASSHIPLELPFIELQSVDSTNNYARQQINAARLPGRQDEAVHGMAIFAHEQVAGKGQRGKAWASQKGENIALSVLIKPGGLALENQFYLSTCIAVTVRDFFAKYAGDFTKIKWPNDLYWQDRKAGGVLIESVVGGGGFGSWELGSDLFERHTSIAKPTGGKWQWAIIGIGININQVRFPAELPNPVSLKQITGKTFEPLALAKELHLHITAGIEKLMQGDSGAFVKNYNEHLYKKGEKVRLRKENRIMEVVVKEVTAGGRLLVQHTIEEEIEFGTVEWVL
jgi:BirA family biotin operon repressor/biotin-[acetyl-CoA-carboxylase] ligase